MTEPKEINGSQKPAGPELRKAPGLPRPARKGTVREGAAPGPAAAPARAGKRKLTPSAEDDLATG